MVILRGMTLSTQSHQVSWSVCALRGILPEAQMMNLQDRVICFVLTVWILALVSIPVQDIFPQVVETVFFSVLILFSLNRGIVDFLDIKCCYFDSYSNDWKDTADFVNEAVMSI